MAQQTQIKERPILFSAPMIRAILSGNKTQTRRVVKDLKVGVDGYGPFMQIGKYTGHNPDDLDWLIERTCPYGEPGDILWVRETFRKYRPFDEDGNWGREIIEYRADGHHEILLSDEDGSQVWNKDGTERWVPWKSPIHMPKHAARIWLRVKDVRVERLQDISEADAKAEGVESIGTGQIGKPETIGAPRMYRDYQSAGAKWAHTKNSRRFMAADSFQSLWQSINGAESWAENPFVWVVEYEVLSTTGKPKDI